MFERSMIELDLGRDPELFRPGGKKSDRDRIAKHVVQPALFRWLGRYIQLGMDETLVETLARPHHDAMLAK
jgi:hypothetical protein